MVFGLSKVRLDVATECSVYEGKCSNLLSDWYAVNVYIVLQPRAQND
jgi:hypothetical protein